MKKRLIGYAAALLAVSMLAGCGAPAAGTGAAADPGSQADTSQAGASQPGTSQSGTSQADASQTGTSQTDASQSAGAEGASITFWHSMGGVNGEALEYLVNKFNSENTMGIQVEAQYQGEYDDAINKLKSAQIGNMGADLVQIYDIGTRFMIDSGWVVPMQELIDGDGWDKTQIEPNIAAYYTVGDTLYSMPFNSSTPLLYYNKDMFKEVGLDMQHLNRYPHEFSGGQRQRLNIARAIASNPRVVICDEPVSALDVSIQAQVINLLMDIKKEMDLTILFIAHNLAVVKYFSDRIGVMHFGTMVELADADELYAHPVHPYTKSLLSAIPQPDPDREKDKQRLYYDPSMHDYSKEQPSFQEIRPGHFVYASDSEMEQYRKEL